MTDRGAATILHADLDAFYASVALLRAPELIGKPVAVGGGVVLSCTYEARAMGVRGGMPLGRARELCPSLIVLDSDFADYVDYSDRVFDVFREFTPEVEPLSIDEAFLDISGSTHLFGPPAEIGADPDRNAPHAIAVRDEREGVSAALDECGARNRDRLGQFARDDVDLAE